MSQLGFAVKVGKVLALAGLVVGASAALGVAMAGNRAAAVAGDPPKPVLVVPRAVIAAESSIVANESILLDAGASAGNRLVWVPLGRCKDEQHFYTTFDKGPRTGVALFEPKAGAGVHTWGLVAVGDTDPATGDPLIDATMVAISAGMPSPAPLPGPVPPPPIDPPTPIPAPAPTPSDPLGKASVDYLRAVPAAMHRIAADIRTKKTTDDNIAAEAKLLLHDPAAAMTRLIEGAPDRAAALDAAGAAMEGQLK